MVASADELASAAKRTDGLIHATPTGMAAHPGVAFDPSLLRPEMWVAEIVYFPLETELLRPPGSAVAAPSMARHDGLASRGAFEHFTGIRPDAARMEAHFLKMVSRAGSVDTRIPGDRRDDAHNWR